MSPIDEERAKRKAEEEDVFVEGYKNIKVKERKIVKGDQRRILIDLEEDDLESEENKDPIDQLFD